MDIKTRKNIHIALLAITFIVLCASLYLQYVQGFQPCPLCLMQRFSIVLILGVLLIGFLLDPVRRDRLITILLLSLAGVGLFFALRQLWIQSLPVEEIGACVPGLDVLIRYFPWHEVAHALFWGSGDCTQIDWTFLGLSMASWSALYFIGMIVINLYFLIVPIKNKIQAE